MISGNSRIESDTEVKDYIAKIKYALDNGAEINFQEKRQVDENRNIKYTNGYTVRALFPDENPVDATTRASNIDSSELLTNSKRHKSS